MAGERVRASDKEREQYASMLRAAMTEGRLTLEEGEERLAQVYAAKFRDELPPLTADLPEGADAGCSSCRRRRRSSCARAGGTWPGTARSWPWSPSR